MPSAHDKFPSLSVLHAPTLSIGHERSVLTSHEEHDQKPLGQL